MLILMIRLVSMNTLIHGSVQNAVIAIIFLMMITNLQVTTVLLMKTIHLIRELIIHLRF